MQQGPSPKQTSRFESRLRCDANMQLCGLQFIAAVAAAFTAVFQPLHGGGVAGTSAPDHHASQGSSGPVRSCLRSGPRPLHEGDQEQPQHGHGGSRQVRRCVCCGDRGGDIFTPADGDCLSDTSSDEDWIPEPWKSADAGANDPEVNHPERTQEECGSAGQVELQGQLRRRESGGDSGSEQRRGGLESEHGTRPAADAGASRASFSPCSTFGHSASLGAGSTHGCRCEHPVQVMVHDHYHNHSLYHDPRAGDGPGQGQQDHQGGEHSVGVSAEPGPPRWTTSEPVDALGGSDALASSVVHPGEGPTVPASRNAEELRWQGHRIWLAHRAVAVERDQAFLVNATEAKRKQIGHGIHHLPQGACHAAEAQARDACPPGAFSQAVSVYPRIPRPAASRSCRQRVFSVSGIGPPLVAVPLAIDAGTCVTHVALLLGQSGTCVRV